MTAIFTEANNRVFYACQGVMYLARQTTQTGGDNEPENSKWLNGVQSISIEYTTPRSSLLDVGRSQRKYGVFGKQQFNITIDRLLTNSAPSADLGLSSFFYNVDGQSTYENTHILNPANIGCDGFSNTLRNYDIVLIYGPDKYKRLGVDASGSDPDADKYMATTYRCCLLTEIRYNIPVSGPVIESLTFTTHIANQANTVGDDWDDLNKAADNEPQTGDTIRRENIDTTNSVLPVEVSRMFDLGTTETGIPVLGLQNIEIGATINYSDIMDVGQWRGSNLSGNANSDTGESAGSVAKRAEQNLFRQVILPVEIDCSFTGVARSQYRAQPTGSPSYDSGTNGTSLQAFENTDTTFSAADGNDTRTLGSSANSSLEVNRQILIAAQKGSNYFQWNLGKRNHLTDINYGGGDTGGSNVEVTMSYTNNVSDFVLLKNSSIVDISPPEYDNGLQKYY